MTRFSPEDKNPIVITLAHRKLSSVLIETDTPVTISLLGSYDGNHFYPVCSIDGKSYIISAKYSAIFPVEDNITESLQYIKFVSPVASKAHITPYVEA